MKRAQRRRIGKVELSQIAALWGSNLTDRELAERFGRHRGVIHRAARQRLGLPPRNFARRREVSR